MERQPFQLVHPQRPDLFGLLTKVLSKVDQKSYVRLLVSNKTLSAACKKLKTARFDALHIKIRTQEVVRIDPPPRVTFAPESLIPFKMFVVNVVYTPDVLDADEVQRMFANAKELKLYAHDVHLSSSVIRVDIGTFHKFWQLIRAHILDIKVCEWTLEATQVCNEAEHLNVKTNYMETEHFAGLTGRNMMINIQNMSTVNVLHMLPTFLKQWYQGERKIDYVHIKITPDHIFNYREIMDDIPVNVMYEYDLHDYSVLAGEELDKTMIRHLFVYVHWKVENPLDQVVVTIYRDFVQIDRFEYETAADLLKFHIMGAYYNGAV